MTITKWDIGGVYYDRNNLPYTLLHKGTKKLFFIKKIGEWDEEVVSRQKDGSFIAYQGNPSEYDIVRAFRAPKTSFVVVYGLNLLGSSELSTPYTDFARLKKENSCPGQLISKDVLGYIETTVHCDGKVESKFRKFAAAEQEQR